MVVWVKVMPRSAIIWTRSRELSLKARYHLTHRMMISWSKCRPLNRSCAEVGSVIPGRYGCAPVFSSLHQNPEALVGHDIELALDAQKKSAGPVSLTNPYCE